MEAIEFTEKQLFELFSSIEKREGKPSNKEYYLFYNSKTKLQLQIYIAVA